MSKDGAMAFTFNKRKNKILLVKRRDIPIWVIPGGGIEDGETPEEAAVRETEEESGYEIKITRKVAEYTHKAKSKIDHVFEAVVVDGHPQLSSESKEIRFFRLDSLPEIRHPFISLRLKDLARRSKTIIKRETSEISINQALGQIYRYPILVIRFLLTRAGIRVNT